MRRFALTTIGFALFTIPASGQNVAWQPAPEKPANAAILGKPQTGPAQPIVRAQMFDAPAINVPEPGQSSSYSAPYYTVPNSSYAPTPHSDAHSTSPNVKGDPVRRTSFSSRSSTSNFGEGVGDTVHGWCDGFTNWCTANGRRLFESDHCVDFFASPVTNPFLFEDPRSLTEVRPIFLWQKIPGSEPNLQGGDMFFYGLQARLAMTDWFSFTINKLGGVSINPDNAAVGDASGLAELHLGPKFTFYRNADWGAIAAAGVIFQIPVGPSNVFQDTGDFSMVPYITAAKNFGRNSYGSFNIMDTFGYSFRVGSDRSDFLYNSIHLDFDVVCAHRFYPFLELNWFHYTRDGGARTIGEEGLDFANLGSTGVSGQDYLTLAGFRYKFTEHVQTGIATEFMLTSPKDFFDFRLTIDMIFRY